MIRPFQFCFLFVCLMGSLVVPSAALAQDGNLLKVVTYNIRFANPGDGPDVWPNRIDAVTEFLDQQDLAGLQEVLYSQLKDLAARLTAFDWYGVGRDDGKHGGEHVVIFYRRDRLEAIDQGTFWLSESPDQVGVAGWDAALPRTCSWMILRDKRSGKSFLVGNTHYDHRGSEARTQSSTLILNRLREKAGDLPVLFLGDFNCEPNSQPYRAILEGGYFADARTLSKTAPSGPDSTWNAFREIQPGRLIDHLFVRGGWEVFGISVLDPRTASGRFASDHLPVQAILEIRPPQVQKDQP